MKRHLIAITIAVVLLGYTTCNVTAQTKPAQKSLKVWVIDGVALKSTPADKSKTLATIPYGTTVKPTRFSGGPKVFKVDFNTPASKEPYRLEGKWVKVDFAGKHGYVFDGYLSTMPILEKDDHGFIETEDAYLKRNYGVLKIAKRIPKKGAKESSIYYKNGAITTETSSDGCTDHKLILKTISLNEAMLFEKVLYKDADAVQSIKVSEMKAVGVKISSYDCD